MKSLRGKGQYQSVNSKHEYSVEVLSYYGEKEKLFYALSLSLDIVGAGASELEAINNFNDLLEDFVKYVCSKQTIASELIRMGWDVKIKGNNEFTAKSPTIEDLKSNPDWADIWSKNPKINNRQVEFAL